MQQGKFTFSKHFRSVYPEDYIPPAHLTIEGEFVDNLLKKGYLVKDIKMKKVVMITGYAARANIPLKERQKLQKKIKQS